MHSLLVHGLRVCLEPLSRESAAFLRLGEPDEEEREGAMLEESLLRASRVLVHCVSDRVEGHERIGEVFIVSVVSMRQDDQLKKFNKLLFCLVAL